MFKYLLVLSTLYINIFTLNSLYQHFEILQNLVSFCFTSKTDRFLSTPEFYVN